MGISGFAPASPRITSPAREGGELSSHLLNLVQIILDKPANNLLLFCQLVEVLVAAVVREEAWDEAEDEAVEVVICLLFHRQCEFHRVRIKVNDDDVCP